MSPRVGIVVGNLYLSKDYTDVLHTKINQLIN